MRCTVTGCANSGSMSCTCNSLCNWSAECGAHVLVLQMEVGRGMRCTCTWLYNWRRDAAPSFMFMWNTCFDEKHIFFL